MTTIAMIVARAHNRVIGKDGGIPWHLPSDMKRFKELTTSQNVVMGRKTFDSLPAKFRPLPNRNNFVVTSRVTEKTYIEVGEAAYFEYPTLDRVVADYYDNEFLNTGTLFIIGGQRMYEEGMIYADTLYITEVSGEPEGDTFFPPIPACFALESTQLGVDYGLGYKFLEYRRRRTLLR